VSPPPDAAIRSRSRNSAIALAAVLGGFGGHSFYLGQPWRGLLRLAFFWTLVPAILTVFDLKTLLAMTDDEFAQRYPG
jgi:TM2 domain-containing membrane protein YozV